MLLLVPSLLAHPGSAPGAPGAVRDTIGHRLEVEITATGVDVLYVAEVPERRVLEEARTEPGYGDRLLATLADGVRLTWDGAPLAAERVAIPDAARAGEKGYLDFSAAWHAELPGTTGRLGIRNANYPDEDAFYATSMTIDGGLVAEEASLLHVKKGRVRDNWHGAWVRDEKGREPWVSIRPAGLLERAAEPGPLPTRMAGLEGERPSYWLVALLLLSLISIAWLGRKLGQRARRLRE